MREAWHDTWANFPLWLVAGLVWLLATILGLVSILGIILVVPVLYWGGYVFVLKMRDGGARIGDLFSGFFALWASARRDVRLLDRQRIDRNSGANPDPDRHSAASELGAHRGRISRAVRHLAIGATPAPLRAVS